MTRVRRSRTHGSTKNQAKYLKGRRSTKDIDQIHEDIDNATFDPDRRTRLDGGFKPSPEDLPGGGEHHCLQCDRHFTTDADLSHHTKSKIHKRRLKQLKEEAYSHVEADAGRGIGRDNRQRTGDGKLVEETMQ
ncbi:uncharacterized protein L969DRAFT_90685 [Mixia osmundae IAM 14324]|uniref:C2H2-type domain-containing protein n=1 Tax=Mixia osmundae (strain CBS 9802 / IAM 14324 / JCM 22182 / KY 12970) TaxID=764103 RepID=G7E1P5_MIXOS|nr:uncharacterized protein L969DRAFT_90685 [Mixia osmundae IAM 14324]KEI36705.1 hypothetical protein L969DRAFT_90685 [Mixia osmundae IAM 14324]GAA96755.1 hypothetical protein E5Q_03426 [Mixia osmundae IAM 14324]